MGFKIIDPNLMPMVVTTEKNLKIVTIGDAHIGGRTGYLPSNCTHERGEPNEQTIHQVTMERNLLSELNKVGKVDVLIFLGDMIEGRNASAGGLDISNVNTDLQLEWAFLAAKSWIEILDPKYILGNAGSVYHNDTVLDAALLRRISHHYPDKSVYYGDILKFIIGDKLWFLGHKCSEGVSKLGTLERYWNKHLSNSYQKQRVPEVIGYAHIHKAQSPAQIKNGPNPVYGFICPCQKMLDPFCSKDPIAPFWEIGFMYLEQNGVRLKGEYINTYEYWNVEQ